MGRVRDLSEALWTGSKTTKLGQGAHPLATLLGLEEYDDGLAFVANFGNVTVVRTDEGLVLVDTGSFLTAVQIVSQVRAWSETPVRAAIYTHGHADHVGGIKAFGEAQDKEIEVFAHEAVSARFDRYVMTSGYNTEINRRQFRVPGIKWPTEYRHPDQTYRTSMSLEFGGETMELHHDRGETDDHTWVWMPKRKALCTGDLFIWASPNCGNPQKVQRYPKEWAVALRKMAALQPEVLFPGHGPPIEGAERAGQALRESAELLESMFAQTLERMNAGMPLDAILQEVEPPAELLERPYLRPVYDEPEFIVRNVWRLYGGWYDGNPANLKPASDTAIARELAALSGGAKALAERAAALSDAGEHRLACHLAQWAGAADPEDASVRDLRKQVFSNRAKTESSMMAQSIYADAAKK